MAYGRPAKRRRTAAPPGGGPPGTRRIRRRITGRAPAVRRLLASSALASSSVLSSRPERKQTFRLFPFAAGTYNFATSFVGQYPTTNWASVDMFPTQGTGDSQFIGSQIAAKSLRIDLIHQVTDQTIECRFVCFRWKSAVSPDNTNTWNNPISGTLSTTGEGWNPWFQAQSDDYVQVLYQKAYRLSAQSVPNTQPSGGTVPGYVLVPARKRIRKTIPLRHIIRPYSDVVGGMTSTTTTQNTSYKNRVYWCIITNNVIGSDNLIAGNVKFTYTDA